MSILPDDVDFDSPWNDESPDKKRIAELEQQLAEAQVTLKQCEHFLTQVDPVHWPSKQEARKVIQAIRAQIEEN